MPLLERILTPINALLPDISQVPRWRQAVGAIVASLVLHLILLLLFIAIVAFIPDSTLKVAQPETELSPLEVQIVTPSEEELVTPEELKAAAERPTIDSTGLAKATEAPKDAIFESDQDMKAASEKPATGDLPLPSQDGRTDLNFPEFKNQNGRDGSLKPGEPSIAQTPPPPQPKSSPTKTSKPAPEVKAPEPKPTKTPEVVEPKPDEIAIAQKLKPRMSSPDLGLRPLPAPAERQEMAKLDVPKPKPSNDPEYQADKFQTQVDGSITNRGRKAVSAEKTPRGVYIKQVNAQLGSRWRYYVSKRADLYSFGTATVRFAISQDGKVSNIRLLDNSSNESYALMCQQSIFEAEITPPPEEALPAMSDGKLEMTVSFNYVPFQ